MIVKAQLLTTHQVVLVEYVEFDKNGYGIYKEIFTGKEYHETDLDFSINDSPSILLTILNLFKSICNKGKEKHNKAIWKK